MSIYLLVRAARKNWRASQSEAAAAYAARFLSIWKYYIKSEEKENEYFIIMGKSVCP